MIACEAILEIDPSEKRVALRLEKNLLLRGFVVLA